MFEDMNNNIDNSISRLNAIIDESTVKATKVVNKYGKPKYIAALIEIIVSATAIMGIQIISMGFDMSRLQQWEFWVRTFALTLCIFLLYRAVINARFEHTAQRESVKEITDEYKKLSKDKDLDLKDFLIEFNLKTKINNYVAKINRRINRLERKRIKSFNLKRKQSLTAKIEILKEEIKPDRVREVIDIVRVKHYIVYYDDFENVERVGGNGSVLTRGNQAYTKAFTKASFNKMWVYILCSAIMAISIWTFGDATVITIIANIISSMVMIVTRIASAFVEADKIYDSTITSAYVCKIDILKQYYQWKEQLKEEEAKNVKTAENEPKQKPTESKPISIGTNENIILLGTEGVA
jgi:hypothetical protein